MHPIADMVGDLLCVADRGWLEVRLWDNASESDAAPARTLGEEDSPFTMSDWIGIER